MLVIKGGHHKLLSLLTIPNDNSLCSPFLLDHNCCLLILVVLSQWSGIAIVWDRKKTIFFLVSVKVLQENMKSCMKSKSSDCSFQVMWRSEVGFSQRAGMQGNVWSHSDFWRQVTQESPGSYLSLFSSVSCSPTGLLRMNWLMQWKLTEVSVGKSSVTAFA